MDFWVRRDAKNASRLIEVVRRFGFGSLGLTEADFLEEDQVVQLGFPPRRIDLLTHLTALDFESSWQNRVSGKIDEITVYYLSREDFIRNKLAVGRPKDLADAEAVRETDLNKP
jgi:hypothetical protein